MKAITKIIASVAVAALGLSACSNEPALTLSGLDPQNFVGEKEKLVLEVRYENVLGNPVLAEVPYTAFEQVSENNYKIVFDGLNATDFRRICDARITENGRAVSNYMSYSIETYAYNRVQDETKPELAALMVAMMKYGDSTAAYFAK
jgi:hypothetical protein